MIIDLVDGTYELFRHFYGQRRFNKGEDKPSAAAVGVLVHRIATREGWPLTPEAAARKGATAAIYDLVEDHFRREHLSPAEVGKLAAACGAKAVVVTHNEVLARSMPRRLRLVAGQVTEA